MELDILNDIIASFIGEEPFIYEDYALISEFVDIIKISRFPSGNMRYHTKLSISKAIKYSLDFMYKLNKRYGKILEHIVNSDDISYHMLEKNTDRLSLFSIGAGVKRIDLCIRGTIEDSYTLSHEAMHYINTDINHITYNWDFMCEVFSLLTERLQLDYFMELPNRPKEYLYTLFSLYVKACQLDFLIKLIFTYHEKGELNKYDIYTLLGGELPYARFATDNIIKVIKNRELNFNMLQRDVIGGILSTHMYERIKKNEKNIDEFIELNDSVNDMTFQDTLRYLDLEVVDEDAIILSDRSNKLLRMEYEKRCRY